MTFTAIIVHKGIIMDSMLFRYFNSDDYQRAGQVDAYKWCNRK